MGFFVMDESVDQTLFTLADVHPIKLLSSKLRATGYQPSRFMGAEHIAGGINVEERRVPLSLGAFVAVLSTFSDVCAFLLVS